MAIEGRVWARHFAECGDGRGAEAEHFVADGVEVGDVVHLLQIRRRGVVGFWGREVGADVGSEAGLDGGVFGEEVGSPGGGGGGCFMPVGMGIPE